VFSPLPSGERRWGVRGSSSACRFAPASATSDLAQDDPEADRQLGPPVGGVQPRLTQEREQAVAVGPPVLGQALVGRVRLGREDQVGQLVVFVWRVYFGTWEGRAGGGPRTPVKGVAQSLAAPGLADYRESRSMAPFRPSAPTRAS